MPFDVMLKTHFAIQPYKRRSQAAKDIREQELNAYMRTLTPDDIKRENAFRSAQRKAGKSRKSNIASRSWPKRNRRRWSTKPHGDSTKMVPWGTAPALISASCRAARPSPRSR
jgi:hypothetical protein